MTMNTLMLTMNAQHDAIFFTYVDVTQNRGDVQYNPC